MEESEDQKQFISLDSFLIEHKTIAANNFKSTCIQLSENAIYACMESLTIANARKKLPNSDFRNDEWIEIIAYNGVLSFRNEGEKRAKDASYTT